MGLFDDVSKSLSSVTGAIRGPVADLGQHLGAAAGRLTGAVDDLGRTVESTLTGAVDDIGRRLGSRLESAVTGPLGDLSRGLQDLGGLVTGLPNLPLGDITHSALTGALSRALGGLGRGGGSGGGGSGSWRGGITPSDAVRHYRATMAVPKARKNLFWITVKSNLDGGSISDVFNMLAVDVDRGPSEISGSKVRAGSAQLDIVQSTEPVTLRITTLDDTQGTLKSWFEQHANAVVLPDGTVGLPGGPGGYAITFTIQHAFVGGGGGFTGRVLCRAQSYEVSQSRREDALEELQMTFTQLDTFL